jgi:hypothetical protein
MVTFQGIQTAYYMVAATGVLVAAAYYVMNIRNTRKTHELQVTMQALSLFGSKAFWNEFDELMARDWQTLEEYHEKYGRGLSLASTVFITLEQMGVLLRRRLIHPSIPWDLYGTYTFKLWEKYEPVIMELRRDFSPDAALWVEYFVMEMRRYSKEHPESEVLTGLK